MRENFDHLFAAMFGIADQPLANAIDDEVQDFEWDLTDQNGAIVGYVGDLDCTIAPLNVEPDRLVNIGVSRAAGRSHAPFPARA